LIDDKLYLFQNESDRKAEQIFDLNQWTVSLTTEANNSQAHAADITSVSGKSEITLENPMLLGCSFKADTEEKTLEVFQKLQAIGESI
jgi:hypothetical protein